MTVLAVIVLLGLLTLLAWAVFAFNRLVRLRMPGSSSGSGGGGCSGGGDGGGGR